MDKLSAAQLLAGIYRLIAYTAVAIVSALQLRRHWPITLTAVLGFSASMFNLLGHRDLSAVTSIPLVGLVAMILVDRVRQDPWRLKNLLGVREAQWSQERHEVAERLAMAYMEAVALRARLERHHIAADDIPSLPPRPSGDPDTI